jgi:hypothetical protein
MSTFIYGLYGLQIKSFIPIPELNPASRVNNAADVIVRCGKVSHPARCNYDSVCIHATNEQIYLFWPDVGTFLVRQGREIVVAPSPRVKDEILRLFILGSGIAVLLHQLGLLVLHGSAVDIEGSAVAFVGDKGWGKSTIAAALHMRGHRFLTDDLVVVQYDQQEVPLLLPSYPQLKLWPDTVDMLGVNPEELPRIRPELEKRAHRLHEGFSQAPVPLKSVYVLGVGNELAIEALPPQLFLMQLVRHLYVARYGTEFLNSTCGGAHISQCARLAACVPVKLLKRKQDLFALSDVATQVENDMQVKASQR